MWLLALLLLIERRSVRRFRFCPRKRSRVIHQVVFFQLFLRRLFNQLSRRDRRKWWRWCWWWCRRRWRRERRERTRKRATAIFIGFFCCRGIIFASPRMRSDDFFPSVRRRACTDLLQKENNKNNNKNNKNNNKNTINNNDAMITVLVCVWKVTKVLRDVSRSSNLCVAAAQRKSGRKKTSVKNLTWVQRRRKELLLKERKEQKKAEEKRVSTHTHCAVTTDVSDKNASLKDDVFYRGRGAIAACDATTTTTTTTTTRNTETNSRGDFPASFSEK